MPSPQTLDPASSSAERVAELLVLRQNPQTRQIIPLGRLVRRGEDEFEFFYTRSAVHAEGLRPLPGFSELTRRYASHGLPTIFAQRVMRSDRPDYRSYLESLGLNPANATPWEQIVQSGGRREGDTLQFMELPSVRSGIASARFFVNGVRHVANGETRSIRGQEVVVEAQQHEQALRRLEPGDQLVAVPEHGNRHDPSAMIVSNDDLPLGWVPQALSASVRELARSGEVPLTVVRLGDPTGPDHQRLVVGLSVPVGDDFRFDREGAWEPA